MNAHGQPAQARFHDLGSGIYDRRTSPDRRKRNHVRQLEALGFKVTLEPVADHQLPAPASEHHPAEPRLPLARPRRSSD